MEGTKQLMEEHRIIEGVLNGLETAAARLRSGLPVRPGFFVDAADFIKGFADGCHHQKEEGKLFPAMESAGVARQGGPIGVMLAEHDEGRRLTRAMREAAEQPEAGQTQAKDPNRRQRGEFCDAVAPAYCQGRPHPVPHGRAGPESGSTRGNLKGNCATQPGANQHGCL
ncbi:MAG: hypothetical protein FJW26_16290 [Acidimicrobiia bacterium]|nr:hypothetical protein [Acidimicrobiia bacterium]